MTVLEAGATQRIHHVARLPLPRAHQGLQSIAQGPFRPVIEWHIERKRDCAEASAGDRRRCWRPPRAPPISPIPRGRPARARSRPAALCVEGPQPNACCLRRATSLDVGDIIVSEPQHDCSNALLPGSNQHRLRMGRALLQSHRPYTAGLAHASRGKLATASAWPRCFMTGNWRPRHPGCLNSLSAD